MRYDITPTKYIDMMTCELGCMPPVSVPVINREIEKMDFGTEGW